MNDNCYSTKLAKLAKSTKLATMFCGPFQVLMRVGKVAYQLPLPSSLKVHNVFHVSLLKKNVHDITHVMNWNAMHVEPEGEFQVELLSVLDRKEIVLWNGAITQVKVHWRSFSLKEDTWEMEEDMRKSYPSGDLRSHDKNIPVFVLEMICSYWNTEDDFQFKGERM